MKQNKKESILLSKKFFNNVFGKVNKILTD